MKRLAWALAAGGAALSYGFVSQETLQHTNGGERPRELQFPVGSALAGVDVLFYATFIDSPDELGNMMSIASGAGANVTRTRAQDPATLQADLAGIDCFVIPELFDDSFHDHPDPGLDQLDAIMTSFRPVLEAWALTTGGHVVVAEGDLSCEPGEVVIDALGVTSMDTALEEIFGMPLTIAEPADFLMAGIPAIASVDGDMTFTTGDRRLKPVVTLSGNPTQLVVAREASFIVLGFDYFTFDSNHAQLLINACKGPP